MISRTGLSFLVFATFAAWSPSSRTAAVEGPTVAGPIGGTDLRAALLPPPGLYGGSIFAHAQTTAFVDGRGRQVEFLRDASLRKSAVGPFFYYVPELTVLGGSIGVGGILPIIATCGRLFRDADSRCSGGAGDFYSEVNWARFFGRLRPSEEPGALPIAEGLGIMLGIGAVFPTGRFSAYDPLSQALSPGTNIWDVAPSVALTYTTMPILAEGTEVSTKLYVNNYLPNAATGYETGRLLNLDFAVTEHVGRFQFGFTGFYAVQIADDVLRGVRLPIDGRRAQTLQVGGVLAYDLPEYASSVRFKALTSALSENTVAVWAVYGSWVRRF